MKIREAFVSEGDLYEVPSEDGTRSVFDYYVDVEAIDGKLYRHKHTFYEGYSAELLVMKINKLGEINEDLWWFEIKKRPSYALGEVDEVSLMDEEERSHKGL